VRRNAEKIASGRTARVLLFPAGRTPPPITPGDDASARHSGGGLLEGVIVLLVEDDFIVAFDMQTALEEQGARVLGPAASLSQARELLASDEPKVAVLDVNLGGEFVFPLADDLLQRNIPFVFATAYSDDDRLFPDHVKSARRLAKPVHANLLVRQLERMLR